MYRSTLSRTAQNSSKSFRLPFRANSSSSTQQKASETAKAAQERAGQALSTAQKTVGRAFESLQKVTGSVGEQAGQALGTYRGPVVYNLSVAGELLKQVYVREGLAPPTSWTTIRNAWSHIISKAQDVAYLQQLLRTGEWVRVGVYGLEAYFFFKVGEILGRRHLVGYKVDIPGATHGH